MAWFWTDDLARLLIESGVADSSVSELLARPAAIAAADEAAALQALGRAAGLDLADLLGDSDAA